MKVYESNMKKQHCTLISVLLLCVVVLLAWKVWTTITLEIEIYTQVEAQIATIANTLSKCKAFQDRNDHSQHNSGLNGEGIKRCVIGTILKDKQCIPCPRGTFSLPGWIACDSHLTCDQIQYDVSVTNHLFVIGQWHYKSAEWSGYQVIHASMETEHMSSIHFDPKVIGDVLKNSSFLHPIGFCIERGTIVFVQPSVSTIKGRAIELEAMMIRNSKCDSWIVRFKLAIDFVRTLSQLHSTPGGPVVLCNSLSLEQTLRQLAITEYWELTLGAFDNLQQRKNGSLIKCSDKEMKGDFVAPEQRWPYRETKVFNIQQQPGYTEASDVWKIPDITETLLGNSKNARKVLDYLSLTHFLCKSEDVRSISAAEVLQQYVEVWKLLVYY